MNTKWTLQTSLNGKEYAVCCGVWFACCTRSVYVKSGITTWCWIKSIKRFVNCHSAGM